MARTRHRAALLRSLVVVLGAARVSLAFCPSSARTLLGDSRYRDASGGDRIFVSGRGETAATRSVVMAGSMAPPRTKAEKTSEQFSLSKDSMVVFGSSQRVEVRR